jgi:hypothetical protein
MNCPICKSDTTNDGMHGPRVCTERDCTWTSDGSPKPLLFWECKQCLRCGEKLRGHVVANTQYKEGKFSILSLLWHLAVNGEVPISLDPRKVLKPYDSHRCRDGGFGVLRMVGFDPFPKAILGVTEEAIEAVLDGGPVKQLKFYRPGEDAPDPV